MIRRNMGLCFVIVAVLSIACLQLLSATPPGRFRSRRWRQKIRLRSQALRPSPRQTTWRRLSPSREMALPPSSPAQCRFTVPTVHLGADQLPDVGWVSSATLTATVPWALSGCILRFSDKPRRLGAMLPAAFTVTQAIGVWTTDGPYGGDISTLRSARSSAGLRSAVRSAGTYRTLDGGDRGRQSYPATRTGGSPMDPLPRRACSTGVIPRACSRSGDHGDSWQVIDGRSFGLWLLIPSIRCISGQWWTANCGALSTVGKPGEPASLDCRTDSAPRSWRSIPAMRRWCMLAFKMDGCTGRRMPGRTGRSCRWASSTVDGGLLAQALAVNPRSGVLLYVALDGSDAYAYRSSDGGEILVAHRRPCRLRQAHQVALLDYCVRHGLRQLGARALVGHQCRRRRDVAVPGAAGPRLYGVPWIDPQTGLPAYLGRAFRGGVLGARRRPGFLGSGLPDGIAGLPVEGGCFPADPGIIYVAESTRRFSAATGPGPVLAATADRRTRYLRRGGPPPGPGPCLLWR